MMKQLRTQLHTERIAEGTDKRLALLNYFNATKLFDVWEYDNPDHPGIKISRYGIPSNIKTGILPNRNLTTEIEINNIKDCVYWLKDHIDMYTDDTAYSPKIEINITALSTTKTPWTMRRNTTRRNITRR